MVRKKICTELKNDSNGSNKYDGKNITPNYKNNSWRREENDLYYVDKYGNKVKNQWIDGYWLGNDGMQRNNGRK